MVGVLGAAAFPSSGQAPMLVTLEILREERTWDLQARGGQLDKAASACQAYLWKHGGREAPLCSDGHEP